MHLSLLEGMVKAHSEILMLQEKVKLLALTK